MKIWRVEFCQATATTVVALSDFISLCNSSKSRALEAQNQEIMETWFELCTH